MDIQIAKWNDRYVDTKRDTTKHFAMILQELIHCPKKKFFKKLEVSRYWLNTQDSKKNLKIDDFYEIYEQHF